MCLPHPFSASATAFESQFAGIAVIPNPETAFLPCSRFPCQLCKANCFTTIITGETHIVPKNPKQHFITLQCTYLNADDADFCTLCGNPRVHGGASAAASDEVQRVIAERKDGKGGIEFRVQWKGELAKDATWYAHTRVFPQQQRPRALRTCLPARLWCNTNDAWHSSSGNAYSVCVSSTAFYELFC